jgi:hypothetical protein
MHSYRYGWSDSTHANKCAHTSIDQSVPAPASSPGSEAGRSSWGMNSKPKGYAGARSTPPPATESRRLIYGRRVPLFHHGLNCQLFGRCRTRGLVNPHPSHPPCRTVFAGLQTGLFVGGLRSEGLRVTLQSTSTMIHRYKYSNFVFL